MSKATGLYNANNVTDLFWAPSVFSVFTEIHETSRGGPAVRFQRPYSEQCERDFAALLL